LKSRATRKIGVREKKKKKEKKSEKKNPLDWTEKKLDTI